MQSGAVLQASWVVELGLEDEAPPLGFGDGVGVKIPARNPTGGVLLLG